MEGGNRNELLITSQKLIIYFLKLNFDIKYNLYHKNLTLESKCSFNFVDLRFQIWSIIKILVCPKIFLENARNMMINAQNI